MRRAKITYEPNANGYYSLTPPEAQAVGEEFEAIAQPDGSYSPAEALARARQETSAFHKWLEWDDAVAGDKHRTQQLGCLRNSIRLVKINHRKERVTIPVSRRVFKAGASGQKSGQEPTSRHFPITKILSQRDMRHQAMRKVFSEIATRRNEASLYEELDELVNVIDKLNARFEKEDKVAKAAKEDKAAKAVKQAAAG